MPAVLENVKPIMIAYLDPNPWQPRLTIDQAKLKVLADNIRDHGFIGNLEARVDPNNQHRYQLAFGHRRAQAAQLAGLNQIPVLIRSMTDKEMAEQALLENFTQEELSYYDEAIAIRRLMQEHGYSTREMAKLLNVSRGFINNRLEIARLPEDDPLMEAARRGKTDMTTIQVLSKLGRFLSQNQIYDLLKRAEAGETSADDLKTFLQSQRAANEDHLNSFDDRGNPVVTITLEQQQTVGEREEQRDQAQARYETFVQKETRVVPEDEAELEAEPPRVVPAKIEPVWEPIREKESTGRRYAVSAVEQLKQNVGNLRAKMSLADFSELNEQELAEWETNRSMMIALLDVG